MAYSSGSKQGLFVNMMISYRPSKNLFHLLHIKDSPRDSNIESIFDIVSQISSTRINLNLGVVINMRLSRPAHYDRLEKLANSIGASMIIIHGKIGKDQGGYDVEVGHAPTIGVDATKPFLVEELARIVLQAARTNESIDYVEPKGDVLAPPLSDRNKSDERDLGDMHVHEFEFCLEPKKEKLRCTKCEELIISGPIYHCVECDDFILHKDCAESPIVEKLLETDRHQFR
ncbi:unnamed protein product [Dovyalis caffra]|uniref:DC1 domain-containing protein n=1 Tax=Dovyalis caffra TaxID=77055 RepID=A0AAV1QPN5_9ROSI|nr:unnamed protein product [Dovyalis caffra]